MQHPASDCRRPTDDHIHSLLPAAVDRAKSYTADSTLLDLPNELIIVVLDNLGFQELYSLSFVCRRLHYMVQPIYFSRYGIPNPSRSIDLRPHNLPALPGLISSLLVVATRSISCLFSRGDCQTEIDRLHLLVSKLSSIKRASLDFWMMSHLVSRMDRESRLTNSIQSLFDGILASHCETFTVKDCFSFIPPPSDPPVEKRREMWSSIRRRFLSLGPCGHPSLLTHDEDLISKGRPVIPRRLKTFKIHSTMLFLPPFLDWTINVLASSSITTLSFEYIRLSPKMWAEILPDITLPLLSRLYIANPQVGVTLTFPTLLAFLKRHPSITTFYYKGLPAPTYIKKHSTPLPRLEILDSAPAYIVYFLQSSNALPYLHRISILWSPYFDLAAVDNALFAIGRRRNITTLRILLPADSANVHLWLREGMDESSNRAECLLHCVKKLELEAQFLDPFSDATRTLFPAWLALFPALQHVVFPPLSIPTMTKESQVAFIRSLREACPKLETVQLGLDTHDVPTWLAMCP